MSPLLNCDVCGRSVSEQVAMITFFVDGARSPHEPHPHLADVCITCCPHCSERSEQVAKRDGLEYDGCHHAVELSGGRAMWHMQDRLWCIRVEPGSAAMKKMFDVFHNLARMRTYESSLMPWVPITHGRPIGRGRRLRIGGPVDSE